MPTALHASTSAARPQVSSRILLLGGFALVALTIGVEPLRPLFVAGSLILTALVVYLSSSASLSAREVVFFAVLFRLLLLPALPSLSDDAFRYIWDGMIQWEGFNPFLYTPSDPALAGLRGSPIFPRLNSPDYFTVYPPVAQALFWSVGWIPPASWPFSYAAMKIVAAACEVVTVLLLARMVLPAALALYAWNPLVVIESAGQLHTEPIMVLAVVGALWAHRQGRSRLAVGSLTAAVWVKLYPVLFLPFLLRRVGWRTIWIAIVVSAGLVIPYADPDAIGNVVSSLSLYVGFFEFYSGPYLLLKHLAYELGGSVGFELVLGLTLAVLFLAVVIRLYALARARNWSLATALFFLMAGFLLTATTIHPWYFVGLLALLPMTPLNPKPWIWLAAFSIPTYLLYTHDIYWPFVWLGWGGWAVLLAATSETGRSKWRELIERLLEDRAAKKVKLVRPHLNEGTEELDRPLSVLDLGAGEGYVGRALQNSGHYNVTLCDVRPSNETELPFVVYDGRNLPFGDTWFDATMLVYTLHHCEDHVAVLREAGRVTSGRVVILESVYQTEIGRRILALMDLVANRIRSHGRMGGYQHFRRTNDWIELIENTGFKIESIRTWGRIHRQALIVASH